MFWYLMQLWPWMQVKAIQTGIKMQTSMISYQHTGMPPDFCENNWKSMCACRLTENEHKKRQKVQKEKDEIGENWEY